MSKHPDLLRRFENTEFSDPKLINYKPFHQRRTTIIASFAYPDISLVDIQTTMESGMNVAQFLPYMTTDFDKVTLIKKVGQATKYLSKKYGMSEWPCATAIQLKTCNIKTGLLETNDAFIILKQDHTVTLTSDVSQYNKCNENQIFVDNPYLTLEVKVGMEISLNLQTVVMEVKEIGKKNVICTVTKAGELRSLDSVCMRGAKRVGPYLSKKDLHRVKLALDYQVDMIIVLYVRHPKTIRGLKNFIRNKRKKTLLICGICTKEGLCNIDGIIKEADGIIVNREFLPYELELQLSYRMLRIQKLIIGKCRQAGKPVYISGDVLESVYKTQKLRPQDATDIANCLLLGVSGFILKPCHCPETVKLVISELTDLCAEIEPFTNDKINFWRKVEGEGLPVNTAMAAVMSCVMMANETQAQLIVIPTVSGRTVYHLNSFRSVCIILAVTTDVRTFRRLQTNRSVTPILYNGEPRQTWEKTVKDRVKFAVEYAVNDNMISYPNLYVILQKGSELSAYCDTVSVYTVTIHKKTLITCPEYYDAVSLKT